MSAHIRLSRCLGDSYDLYDPERIPLPAAFRPGERPDHPAIRHLREVMDFRAMTDEGALRRIAAAYYALVTHVDEQTWQVMKAAEELGLRWSRRAFSIRDHGELYGAQGLFGKSCLYEGSAGVPLLISGAEVPAGRVIRQLVSHVDLFPTILEGAGLAPAGEADRDLPGVWLFPAMNGAGGHDPSSPNITPFGRGSGSFMLREGDLWLVYHVGLPTQEARFDLATDPQELRDLAADGTGEQVAVRLERHLRKICDPEASGRCPCSPRPEGQGRVFGAAGKTPEATNFAYKAPRPPAADDGT